MEEPKTKTVRFDEATNQKLESLAAKLGLSKRVLLVQMVAYFYRTRKDPADVSDELLKNTLVKSHKAYMGFIKAQEELLLIPMKQGMDKMIANQHSIVKFFNEQVLQANKSLLKNQQEMRAETLETEKLIQTIYRRIEQKVRLKTKFRHILSQYIKAREELGSFKGKEREELAAQTLQQIENL